MSQSWNTAELLLRLRTCCVRSHQRGYACDGTDPVKCETCQAADTIDALIAQRRRAFAAGSEATFGTHGGKWWWRGHVYETLDDAFAAYLEESTR